MTPVWRPLTAADLDDVIRISASAHVGLQERRTVFAEKLRLYPQGCLAFERAGAISGYVFSHPWTLGQAPPLDGFLGALPDTPDCFYIHDLALAPEARGLGAAGEAVARLTEIAGRERLPALALIAVNGADAFWARAGFEDASDARLAAKLATYGAGARYMIRQLPHGPGLKEPIESPQLKREGAKPALT